MDKLPLFRFKVDDDGTDIGVDAVALVSNPAIELNWQKFSNEKVVFQSDAEKRIISGPLMVAELPIYRRDETGQEYYGYFTSEDIFNIVKKFFRNGYTNKVNLMHDSSLMVDGVFLMESFLVDSKRGINSPKGYNLTDGSWFGSFRVDNEEVWNEYIKTGEFKGFSIEGLFDKHRVTKEPISTIESIIEVVKNVDSAKVNEVKNILEQIEN